MLVCALALVIPLYVCAVVFYNLGLSKSENKSNALVTSQKMKLSQDETLKSRMESLGLNVANLNIYYSETPSMETKELSGEFTGTNTLKVRRSVPEEKLNQVISHEYMHYVWATLSPVESQSFTDYLTSFLYGDEYMQNRLEKYFSAGYCGKDSQCQILNEVSAYACTEVPDYALDKTFLAYCNKWLPHRAELL